MQFYLSHSIRGPKGQKATKTDMQKNCKVAIQIANQIRNALPSIELYVPAEQEKFVQLAYKFGYLTEQEILEIDCRIIALCDGVIVWLPNDNNILQGGRLVEYNFASKRNMPVCKFTTVKQVVKWLTAQIVKA